MDYLPDSPITEILPVPDTAVVGWRNRMLGRIADEHLKAHQQPGYKVNESVAAASDKLQEHVSTYLAQLDANPALKAEYDRLIQKGQQAQRALDNATGESGAAARATITETREQLTLLIKGELKGFEDPALKTAHDAIEGFYKRYNSLFGKLDLNGGAFNWRGLVDTTTQNFKSSNKGIVFARGAGVAVGAVAMGDALMRGKDGNGKDRGALGRMAEFVAGGGVAAGSALVGRAF